MHVCHLSRSKHPRMSLIAERTLGPLGKGFVLWSLLALLLAAAVTVHIIATDLGIVMLCDDGADSSSMRCNRKCVAAGVTLVVMPMCLPQRFEQLKYSSTGSLIALFLTCATVFSLFLRGHSPSTTLTILPPTMPIDSVRAMPIDMLAFCSQFSVLDVAHEMGPKLRSKLPAIIHSSMAVACILYISFAVACYVLLGDEIKNFPNVLMAFGGDSWVVVGSIAILFTNLLKFPLVVLPFRSLLLERMGAPSMGAAVYSIATFTIIFAIAGLALTASDLAFAFEVTGCTTGVMICFCLPGCMYFSARRAQRRQLFSAQLDPHSSTLACAPRGTTIAPKLDLGEVGGLTMSVFGIICGVVGLFVILGYSPR